MTKSILAILLITIVVGSLAIAGTIQLGMAQTNPSVPEFTLKFVDHSYVVPTSTSIDPYTGQQIIHPSYTVENKTIDITIKNQPFVPPNNLINLYYDVRVKGHFEENWTDLYYISNNTPQNSLPMQSASENTVISTPQDYPAGGLVDFQVEAVIATAHPLYGSSFGYWSYETSGWSNTQTITINTNTPSPTPSISPSSFPTQQPTLEPSQSANPTIAPSSYGVDPLPYILVIVALVIVVITLLGLAIYFKKQRNKKTAN